MREHAVLHAGEEHDRVLQPLGGVQRHQRDRALLAAFALGGVEVGDQRDRLEERLDARQALRDDDVAGGVSAVPTPAMPGRPDTSPASSAWSNSRHTPTSSWRFSTRPRASIERSASSSARYPVCSRIASTVAEMPAPRDLLEPRT